MSRVLVIGVVLSLAGCSAAQPAAESPNPAATDAPDTTADPDATAVPVTVVDSYASLPDYVIAAGDSLQPAWSADEVGQMAVIVYGSSTCPVSPVSYDSTTTSTLSLVAQPTTADVCTSDLAPFTTVIKVPDGFAEVTEVTVNDESAIRLERS